MRYLSLFSGIEAATMAWHCMGWEPVAFAEVDPFASAVLAYHYPDVPNLGDVTKITSEQIKALGRLDLVVGGSPCQDLSVAGKRAGLSGERSGLFHEQLRIFHAARHLCGARFLVWENVPGAYSLNQGRDFAVVVGEMAGCRLRVPGNGWRTAGACLGPNGLVEWRCLDAQYVRVESFARAVPQRRRRVFAVLDTGDWASRPPILLEPESLRGNPPPRREAGEETADRTGNRAQECGASGEAGRKSEPARAVAPDVAGTMKACKDSGGWSNSADHAAAGYMVPECAPTMRAGGNKTGGDRPPGTDVDTCESLIPSVANPLTHRMHKGINTTLDEGQTPIPVAFAQNSRDEVRKLGGDGGIAGALAAEPGMKQQTYVAFSCKDYGADAGESAPTLRAMGHDGSHANAGGQLAVANAMAVRRLTPVECERLQGFPDNFTRIPWRNKPAEQCPDGPRYKALGNSMAVNVMQWLGERIQMVSELEAAP